MRANKSNYITSKVHFIERLNTLGFKRKDMNEFTAKMNDADLKICVTHSTYYIPHVRFYSMAFSVMYPKVFELLDLINNRMVELTGNQIGTGYYPCLYSLAGHIMQPKRFQQWKVAESDDEAYIEALSALMDNVNLRKQMGNAARLGTWRTRHARQRSAQWKHTKRCGHWQAGT